MLRDKNVTLHMLAYTLSKSSALQSRDTCGRTLIVNKCIPPLQRPTFEPQLSTSHIYCSPSTMTDRSELDIISSNPIKLELDSLRDRFRSQCDDLDIPDTPSRVVLWIGNQFASME